MLLKIGAEIPFFNQVVLVPVADFHTRRGFARFFLLGPLRYLVERGGALGQFFENGVHDHLLVDHLAQLELVEREHADHLHQAGRQNLLLRHLEVQTQPSLRTTAHQSAS